jgi:nitrite reductase (NADH) small subunit
MADDTWHDAGPASELATAGKRVVELEGRRVLLLWNEGDPVALDDTCIHRQRSLAEGVLLGGRIVCPGHQWAFELDTGYCKARDQYQPVHEVEVDGDVVRVSLSADCLARRSTG